MSYPTTALHQRLISWAAMNGTTADAKGYVTSIQDNLFEPMESDVLFSYQNAAGKELDSKMRALHSSSALIVNMLHYWKRTHQLNKFVEALNIGFDGKKYAHCAFEQTHDKPKDVGGTKPHLDAELTGPVSPAIAIEAKFTEPYSKQTKTMSDAYKSTTGWNSYENCRRLVERICDGQEIFECFDAPQVLKHALGLIHDMNKGLKLLRMICKDDPENPDLSSCNRFVLVFLWFKMDCEEARKVEGEIARFQSHIKNDFQFYARTYQDVFNRLIGSASHNDAAWVKYMAGRYF